VGDSSFSLLLFQLFGTFLKYMVNRWQDCYGEGEDMVRQGRWQVYPSHCTLVCMHVRGGKEGGIKTPPFDSSFMCVYVFAYVDVSRNPLGLLCLSLSSVPLSHDAAMS